MMFLSEKAKIIEIAVTEQDLKDMIEFFSSRKNSIGILSTGDMVMVSQLSVELEKFEQEK